MKEKIKTAVINKFKKLGYSAKTLNQIVELVEPNVTEESEIDGEIDKLSGILTIMQPEIDRIATKKAEVIASKKAEEAAGDGDDDDDDDDKGGQGKDAGKGQAQKGKANAKTDSKEAVQPDLKKLLSDMLNPLIEKIGKLEGAKVSENRGAVLKQRLKDKGISDKLIEKELKTLEKLKDLSDDDFESHVGELETDLADFLQETNANNFSNQTPPGKGAGSNDTGKVKLATADELKNFNVKL